MQTRVLRVWAPPPKLTISEWADLNRRLSAESSAQQGKFITSRAEFQRGMMDACSDPLNSVVVFKTSAQIGKTTIIENVLGFHMHQDAAPILCLQPTIEMAETFSKDRLAPMLRDTPCLLGRVSEAKSRDSGNTLLHKSFPGGHLTMAGANSPASLASRPVRIVLCDEIDRYPDSAGTEGDPVKLAQKRSTAFWNSLLILTSTPTVQGLSRIDIWYERSDQRKYFVPCPACGEFQILEWMGRVRWEHDDPSTALYYCKHCEAGWTDAARLRAVRRGEWRATKPFRGIAGFHVNEIYSPFVKLTQMAQSWLDAQADLRELKVFVNTALGECWKEKEGEAPDWRKLYERRDDYPIGKAPQAALYVTAGVDVQKDRIEVSHWGWGRSNESWLIDHVVLDGDTSRDDVWDRLSAELERTFEHPSGARLAVVRLAIDSGYATQEVYRWSRRYQGTGRVLVLDPRATGSAAISQPRAVDVTRRGKTVRRGARVWPTNVSMLKSELYGWLQLDKPTTESKAAFPKGYVHLNARADEEFCKQIVAEQLFITVKKGYRKYEWQKMRERNEALDCRNYARAAAIQFGAERFEDKHFAAMDAAVAPAIISPVLPTQPETHAPPKRNKRPVVKRARVVGRFNY